MRFLFSPNSLIIIGGEEKKGSGKEKERGGEGKGVAERSAAVLLLCWRKRGGRRGKGEEAWNAG